MLISSNEDEMHPLYLSPKFSFFYYLDWVLEAQFDVQLF
jgi:hypothetical protein